MYQVRVLGEFPSEAEDTLIPLRLIERAAEAEEAASPVSDEPAVSDEPVEIGVDVARFGADRTVICVRRGDRVIEMEALSRQDTMETAGRVKRAIGKYRPSIVRVDEIGLGAGVLDRLREQGCSMVTGVNVAARSSRPEHFANLRAELYDGLRERFQQERVRIPGDPDLIGELAAVRYSFTSSGQVKIEGKEELRARGLRSPDKADALMLAFAATRRRGYRVWW